MVLGVTMLPRHAAASTCPTPSVQLSASQTVVDANAPSSLLTASIDSTLCSPYMVTVYDDLGNRVLVFYPGQGQSRGVNVTPANNQTRTYTAYVSQDSPNPGPPTLIASTSNAVTVQNVGWDGTVTLTTNTTQTDANSPTAALSISLSKPIVAPYILSVYDDQGNRIADWYPGQQATGLNVTPGNNQTRTYTAEVSQDVPSPGPPHVDVRSPQSVTIQNVGWDGTVTLTTNTTQTDANSPTAALSISLSKPIVAPYVLSVYDDRGNRIADWYPGQQATGLNVTPGNNQTRTYTAEVSQDVPSPGPPSVDVRSPQSVTISDQGWTGSLELTASPSTVTPSNPNALLTMTLSKPLAGPYILSLYDDQGNRIADWYPGQQATSVYVTPNRSSTVTYTAYVSQDVPSPGPPIVDVRDTASVTYTNGTNSDESMQDVDLGFLTGLFASESDEQIVLDFCASPEATHFEESTVCDEGLDYEAAIAAGEDREQAFKDAMKKLGQATAGFIGSLIMSHMVQPSPPQAVPQTPPPPPPAPSDPTPPEVIAGPTLSYNEWLAELYQDRAAEAGYQVSPAAAQTGARDCVKQATWAIQSGADIQDDACATLPIFFPGRNSLSGSGTAPTTQHDWDAITGSGGVDHSSPSWIQLNYVSANDRIASGLNRQWYNPSICQGTQGQEDCDEYPFFATAQSGPASFAGPPGASVRLLDFSDNRSQGSRYRWFAQRCTLVSGGTDKNTAASEGTPFLVIPIPSPAAPITFGVCGGS